MCCSFSEAGESVWEGGADQEQLYDDVLTHKHTHAHSHAPWGANVLRGLPAAWSGIPFPGVFAESGDSLAYWLACEVSWCVYINPEIAKTEMWMLIYCRKVFLLISGCLKKGVFRNTFMAFAGHMTYNKKRNIRYETAEKFNFVSQPTSSNHRRKCLWKRNAVILQLCFVDILEILRFAQQTQATVYSQRDLPLP